MGDTVIKISLLGEFRLRVDGNDVECPARCQRLLSLLVLRTHPLVRRHAAATLWPDEPTSRAMGNIRAAICGARRISAELIACDGHLVTIGPDVAIDLREALEEARRALNAAEPQEVNLDLLQCNILERWDDEWVLVERERFRQLRLHALERTCRSLAHVGSYYQAIDAGLLAVSAEPLRESAHRALIEAHLAEGNRFEADRQYRSYLALLDEFGIGPSLSIGDLVGGATQCNEKRNGAPVFGSVAGLGDKIGERRWRSDGEAVRD
jgi:DNA-binding SARP family transcriptional activator